MYNAVFTDYKSAADVWPKENKAFTKATNNKLFCSLQAENTGDVSADTKRLMDNLKGI